MVDTGSNVTAVAPAVLQQLGVSVASTALTHTAAGQTQVRLFEVSLRITNPNVPNSPWLTLPNLRVTELPVALPDADVLIGLDVLLECSFLLDGPARLFTLEF
jgi:hypothetical protein